VIDVSSLTLTLTLTVVVTPAAQFYRPRFHVSLNFDLLTLTLDLCLASTLTFAPLLKRPPHFYNSLLEEIRNLNLRMGIMLPSSEHK